MKKYLIFFVRCLVSISLIWYLLSRVEFSAVFASIKSANLLWLVLSFITLGIGKILTSVRWQLLLNAQGVSIRLLSLIASVYIGQFFNSFLPTTVGGDAIRAYDTAAQSKQTTKSVISVFADRLIGVFALALLSVIALLVGYFSGQEVSFYLLPVLLVFLFVSFGVVLVFNVRLASAASRLLNYLRLPKAARSLQEAFDSLQILKARPRVLFYAFLLSLLLQVNVVLFYYFIGVSLDLGVSLLYFSIIVPVVLVVLLVPFSINGIGIREGIFVYLLTQLGVEPQDAIALSLISFGLMLTQGIIGGIIFAIRGVGEGKSSIEGPAAHESRQ
jgi:uncharacterized protein (TIRG00374 family)